MSRQKQLRIVFVVANAQKQGAERGECTEPRYATMFQEESWIARQTPHSALRNIARRGDGACNRHIKRNHCKYCPERRARQKRLIIVFGEAMSRVARKTRRVYCSCAAGTEVRFFDTKADGINSEGIAQAITFTKTNKK